MMPNTIEKNKLINKLIAIGLPLLLLFHVITIWGFNIHETTTSSVNPTTQLPPLLLVFGLIITLVKVLILAFILIQIALLFDLKTNFLISFLSCLIGALTVSILDISISVYMHIFKNKTFMTIPSSIPSLSLASVFYVSSPLLNSIMKLFDLSGIFWCAMVYLSLKRFGQCTHKQSMFITGALGFFIFLIKMMYTIYNL